VAAGERVFDAASLLQLGGGVAGGVAGGTQGVGRSDDLMLNLDVLSSSQVNANFAALKAVVDTLEGKPQVGFSRAASGTVNLPSSGPMVDIVMTTITTPAQGFIQVLATGQGNLGTSGTSSVSSCADIYQIDEIQGGIPDGNFTQSTRITIPGVNFVNIPFSITRVYSKPAGAYNFRLKASKDSSSDPNCSYGFINTSITATFIPTSYGAVATSAR
jgi:hypothetical protein